MDIIQNIDTQPKKSYYNISLFLFSLVLKVSTQSVLN